MTTLEQASAYVREYRQLPVVATAEVHPYYVDLTTVATVGALTVQAVQEAFE